ncbi:CHRD domain-containing protein [Pontibacter lucknowensis]|uniref:CHRD domain-containing protein n=2 Tax=Pontibacter lucknowensis TaxID=1077936 RepID=A0A1N6YFT9_9BACT|nr:CHRD domain-containing protein [Pontibacter lucknowensis]
MKMKTYRINFGILLGALLSMTFMFSACDDDDDTTVIPDAEIVTLNEVALTGANEVPPVNTQATGTFRGTYNMDTKVINYTITFQGITPTAMHFHRGAVGVAGPITIPINPGTDPYSSNNPYLSPLVGATPPLTATQEAELLAGEWYINIHSSQYPDGELRGQITR